MFSVPDEPDHRRQLRESVADFVAREVSSKAVRDALASDAGFCRDRYRKMADLGWTALLIPEEVGGLGLAHGDLAALHHEIGRAALPEPLLAGSLLAARLIALGSNASLQEKVLPALLAGERVATIAWQTEAGGLGAADVGTVATPLGDGGYRLSGCALFVPHADAADGMVVAARADEGVLLAWIDGRPACTGLSTHADGSRQGSVSLDGVAVGADAVVALPSQGARLLEEALDTARLAASAELVGLMEKALTMTLDHLKQRSQFGRPVASFQALQHRAVDLYIQVEMARSALGRAVAQFEGGCGEAERAAGVSAAKSRCGEAALKIARESIQMHGAIGYTDEYDLSLYVRRALALSAWLGNPRAHRQRWLMLQGGEGAFADGH